MLNNIFYVIQHKNGLNYRGKFIVVVQGVFS